MAELKTKETEKDVFAFLDTFVGSEQKMKDSLELIAFMEAITGEPAKLWGDSIIGFGKYHYKSTRSKQEGDWPLIGFSPRKAAISLYVFSGMPEHTSLLEGLGKYKMGKACIYIKKCADIDMAVLKKMALATIAFLKDHYGDAL